MKGMYFIIIEKVFKNTSTKVGGEFITPKQEDLFEDFSMGWNKSTNSPYFVSVLVVLFVEYVGLFNAVDEYFSEDAGNTKHKRKTHPPQLNLSFLRYYQFMYQDSDVWNSSTPGQYAQTEKYTAVP